MNAESILLIACLNGFYLCNPSQPEGVSFMNLCLFSTKELHNAFTLKSVRIYNTAEYEMLYVPQLHDQSKFVWELFA